VLVAALAVHACLAIVFAIRSGQPAFDFDRYYEIASQPGRPYVDHPTEQTLATVAVFRGLAHLPGGRAGFGLGMVALNVVADAVIVAALLWGWGEAVAAVFAAMVILVLDLFFNRIDPWPVAAATLAVAAWRRGAPRRMGTALALGVGFKLWPFALAGALLVPPPATPSKESRRFRVEAVTSFVAIGGALAALTLLVSGLRGVGQVMTFRGASGWQIEGLIGSFMHLLGATPRFESGSWRIGTTSGPVSIALFATAAPLSLASSWLGARRDRIGTGWLAAVSVLLLLSALFSSQYVIWLIPAAAIAWSEGATALVWSTALVVALTTVFWSGFVLVLEGAAPMLVVVVLRNLVLLAVAALSFARLARTRPPSI
jgi:hypothetical protein